jgi:hypothetical protein
MIDTIYSSDKANSELSLDEPGNDEDQDLMR